MTRRIEYALPSPEAVNFYALAAERALLQTHVAAGAAALDVQRRRLAELQDLEQAARLAALPEWVPLADVERVLNEAGQGKSRSGLTLAIQRGDFGTVGSGTGPRRKDARGKGGAWEVHRDELVRVLTGSGPRLVDSGSAATPPPTPARGSLAARAESHARARSGG